jgi:hypothetical protein
MLTNAYLLAGGLASSSLIDECLPVVPELSGRRELPASPRGYFRRAVDEPRKS